MGNRGAMSEEQDAHAHRFVRFPVAFWLDGVRYSGDSAVYSPDVGNSYRRSVLQHRKERSRERRMSGQRVNCLVNLKRQETLAGTALLLARW